MKKAINISLDETLLNVMLPRYGALANRSLDEMIADKRIDEIKSGKAGVMSLEEVAKNLSLANV